jgi:uncharacterized protein YjaZ
MSSSKKKQQALESLADRFTQDDLNRVVAKWKKILLMEHYNIDPFLVRRVNKKDDLGECSPQYGINYFPIKIKDPFYIEDNKNGDQDVEATVVHEILHCRRFWEVGESDPVKCAIQERDIDEMSKILVSLHRGL